MQGLISCKLNKLENVLDVRQKLVVRVGLIEVAAVQDTGEGLDDVLAQVLCVGLFGVVHGD